MSDEICPECGSATIVRDSNGAACSKCGLVFDPDVTTARIMENFNLDDREWQRTDPSTRSLKGDIGIAPSTHVWLANRLGLTQAAQYLQRKCVAYGCDTILKKGARTGFCSVHYAEYRRKYYREQKAKQRARKNVPN